jgi:hypothetical protein
MGWDEYAAWLPNAWQECLDQAADEKDPQRFLELHPSLLPGATDNVGPGGHHGPCYDAVITQPSLFSSSMRRVPDFMWVRRDTAAIRPICIEIERPQKTWYTGSGQQTADLTQAMNQIIEWRDWFSREDNVRQFKNVYVPDDIDHRRLVPQFVLIYGRDAEFRVGSSTHADPERLRAQRDLLGDPAVTRMTFDMLRPTHEARDYVTLSGQRGNFEVRSVPPTFTMGPATGTDLLVEVADPRPGLAATGMIAADRQGYLSERWAHWREVAIRAKGIRTMQRGE